MGLTPDQVLDLQHKFEDILKKHHDVVEHVGNDHVVDDYIFTFKIAPASLLRLKKFEKDVKHMDYYVDINTITRKENDDWIFDIIVCYPDD